MKIVIAPGTFKGSLTAAEAARAMARGVGAARAGLEMVLRPVGDGGEGTASALADALPGSREVSRCVIGPMERPVNASFVLLGPDETVAALDMASAAGLLLVPTAERNPLQATTLGVGQLIRHALETQGVEHLIIGLGGSATNDGGAGCLQGLGLSLLDVAGVPIPAPVLPTDLARVASIDDAALPPSFRRVRITIASDVDNPLSGPRGAARVFGPQKGATPETVERLDTLLAAFGVVLDTYARGCADSGAGRTSIALPPGAGAAGGLGAALMAAFPQAKVTPGIDVVLDAIRFDEALQGADLVLTGEGRLDSQTLGGKAIHGVLKRAAAAGVPVVAIAGSVEDEAVESMKEQGLLGAIPLVDLAGSVDQAIAEANQFIEIAARMAIESLAADV